MRLWPRAGPRDPKPKSLLISTEIGSLIGVAVTLIHLFACVLALCQLVLIVSSHGYRNAQ